MQIPAIKNLFPARPACLLYIRMCFKDEPDIITHEFIRITEKQNAIHTYRHSRPQQKVQAVL